MSLRGVRACADIFFKRTQTRETLRVHARTHLLPLVEKIAHYSESSEREFPTPVFVTSIIYITVRYIFRSLRAIVFKGIFERRTARAESRRLLVVGGPPSSLLRCPRLFFR